MQITKEIRKNLSDKVNTIGSDLSEVKTKQDEILSKIK